MQDQVMLTVELLLTCLCLQLYLSWHRYNFANQYIQIASQWTKKKYNKDLKRISKSIIEIFWFKLMLKLNINYLNHIFPFFSFWLIILITTAVFCMMMVFAVNHRVQMPQFILKLFSRLPAKINLFIKTF